jgi:hypothetical protein
VNPANATATMPDFEVVGQQRQDTPVARLRRTLLRNGYTPLPLNGKAPTFKEWPKTVATDALISDWQNQPELSNSGILTARNPTVDIDIYAKPLADELHAFALKALCNGGAKPLVRIGMAPKRALIFRTEDPFPKVSTAEYVDPEGRRNKVEVLADGQQTVVDGIHPDTGRPYTFVGSEISECPSNALPVLTQQMAQRFITVCENRLRQTGWLTIAELNQHERQGRATAGLKNQEPATLETVEDALEHIDSDGYDDWIRVGLALCHEFGDAGRSLWERWSANSSKYDPKTIDAKWRSFANVRSIGVGSIFWLAQQRGWRRKPDAESSRLAAASPAPVLKGPIQQPWPVMDQAAYYGLAGDIVRTIGPHSEADPNAILLHFLSALGNAIGRGPFFQVEGDLHFTKINVVLVGSTASGRKGTALGRVLQVMEKADPNWCENCVKSGLSSGEGLIHHIRDAVIRWNYKTSQHEKVDDGVDDKRLFIDAQEFASPLSVMERAGNTLSPVIRDAFGHRALQTLGKNSPEKATGSHISINGHITPEELRRKLTRTELANGFGNRILWVKVKRSKFLPHGGHLAEAELERIGKATADAIVQAKNIHRVTMADQAAEDWAKVYEHLGMGATGIVGEVIARAAPIVIRLALIYAVIDLVATVGGETQIHPVHLRAAIAVWQYCEDSARQIFGGIIGDPIADTILAALRSKPGLTRTDISDLFSRNETAAAINTALTAMLTQRRARSETAATDGRGRPVERWFLVEETN